MKPSDPLSPGQPGTPSLFRLRLFKYFYVILSVSCAIWFLFDVSWEPAALTVLGFLGLGSLGPQFAQIPKSAMSGLEVGATAGNLMEPSVSQSWLATMGDSILGGLGIAFQALIHAFVEGILYLLVAGVIFTFQLLAGLI